MRVEAFAEPEIRGTGTCGDGARDHARLVDAAQQFEAILMREMLKPLQSNENRWDVDEKDADKAMDTMSSFGIEAVAKAIAKGGGLGIARKVVEQVTKQDAASAKKELMSTKVSTGQADELK